MLAAGASVCLAGFGPLAGCSARGTWTEADELREKLLRSETELASARAERDEARAKLAEIERVRLSGSGDLAADAVAALPRCAGIEIDSRSGLSRDHRSIEVWVRPFDGQRRFLQVVGTMRLRADYLPAPSENSAAAPSEPRRLASAEFGPAQVRDAYRSSFMGTHYAYVIPLEAPADAGPGAIALSAEWLDALSGQVHKASSLVSMPAQRPGPASNSAPNSR